MAVLKTLLASLALVTLASRVTGQLFDIEREMGSWIANATAQVDAQRSHRNGMPEMTQFFSNIANNGLSGLNVLSSEEVKVCWSEGKDDEAKMNGCLAKTISTWLAVFESEEGLNCLLAAKDNIGKIRACKANGATAQVDAQQSPPEREAIQFVSNAWNNVRVAVAPLGLGELKECWSEGKDDEAKMNGCLAKAISTWLAVLESEEGLNCLLAAKDNIGKIRACKANGATAQVDATMHVEREAEEFVLNALETFAVNGPSLGREEALECWSEGKDDEAKMHACLAKTISTWLAVFRSEDGLKCLLAAKDRPIKIHACKAAAANGATAVNTNFLLGASLATLLLVRAS